MRKLKLIDLFAGAGGLSLGFKMTNDFDVVAAVEKNQQAKKTYHQNFPNVDLYGDVRELNFKDFNEKYGGIDVVIGGPPCQGFSNANRQHNQAINLNNKLVKQYIRAILEIQPKAFAMENVSMLKSDVHRFYIERTDKETIEKYSIECKDDYIHLLNKEYCDDGLIDLLLDKEQVYKNKWNQELFKDLNILYKNKSNDRKFLKALNNYFNPIKKLITKTNALEVAENNKDERRLFSLFENEQLPEKEELISALIKPIKRQTMFNRVLELYDNGIEWELGFDETNNNLIAKVKSCAVYDYLTKILGSDENDYALNNGILSAVEFGIPQKRKRFVIIGVKKKYCDTIEMPKPPEGVKITTVRDAIADLENVPVRYSVDEDEEKGPQQISKEDLNAVSNLKQLRDTNGSIMNHIVPNTRAIAMERFKALKEGQNFHALSKEMKENTYTNASRTQNTVYWRLSYDSPSGTVINVRKSMWIHPKLNRAISVREAARMQTFPDSFIICGTKDSQYQQVGNAVPPMLASEIAKQVLKYLQNNK